MPPPSLLVARPRTLIRKPQRRGAAFRTGKAPDQIAKEAAHLAGNARAVALHKGLRRDARGTTLGPRPVLYGSANGEGTPELPPPRSDDALTLRSARDPARMPLRAMPTGGGSAGPPGASQARSCPARSSCDRDGEA